MIADLKPYPAMKDSGVPWLGEVPEHWDVRRHQAVVPRAIARAGMTNGCVHTLLSLSTKVSRSAGGRLGPCQREIYERISIVVLAILWYNSMQA